MGSIPIIVAMNDFRITLQNVESDTSFSFDCSYDLAIELYTKLQELPGIHSIEVYHMANHMVWKTWKRL